MRIIKVQHEGKLVDAEELDWQVMSGETWSVYKFADGTTGKVRTMLTQVARIVGQRAKDGSPVYVMQNTATVVIQPEPHMMVNEN